MAIRVVLVGSGNMGRAMLSGWLAAPRRLQAFNAAMAATIVLGVTATAAALLPAAPTGAPSQALPGAPGGANARGAAGAGSPARAVRQRAGPVGSRSIAGMVDRTVTTVMSNQYPSG
jgi:hypothetical protein